MSDALSDKLKPVDYAFRVFIKSLTPKSYDLLMDYLLLINRSPDEPCSDCVEEIDETVDNICDTPPSRKIKSVPSETGSEDTPVPGAREKLRPLNCFIAFRSYYSPIFPELTQKAKSGILKSVWKTDPFKARWAILAKAYSILRDHHGKDVALDSFLFLTARYLDMIEPPKYFEKMGLSLVLSLDQQYDVEKIAEPQVDLTLTTTNFSVQDVINYCYDAGYVCRVSQLPSPPEDKNGQMVTFATQPNVAHDYLSQIAVSPSDEYQIENYFGIQELAYEESPSNYSPLSGVVDMNLETRVIMSEVDLAIETFRLRSESGFIQDDDFPEENMVLISPSRSPSEDLEGLMLNTPIEF